MSLPGRIVDRPASQAGTCMSGTACPFPAIRQDGSIAPHARVLEFDVGAFRARLCRSCAKLLLLRLIEAVA